MQCVILQPHTGPLGPLCGAKHRNLSHLFTRPKHIHLLLSLPESKVFSAFRKFWQVQDSCWKKQECRRKEDRRQIGKIKRRTEHPLECKCTWLQSSLISWYTSVIFISQKEALWLKNKPCGKCHHIALIRNHTVTFWYLVILQNWQSIQPLYDT